MMKLSISSKVYAVVFLQIFSLVLLLMTAIYSLQKLRQSSDDTIDRVMMMRVTSNRVLQRIYTFNDLLKEMLLNSDPAKDQELSKHYDEYVTKINSSFDDLIGYSQGEAKKSAETAKADFALLHTNSDKIQALALENKTEEGYALYKTSTYETQEKIYKAVRFVTEEATKDTAAAKQKDSSLYAQAQWLMLAVFFSSVIVGLGFSFVILRSLKNSVTRTVSTLTQSATYINDEAHHLTTSSQKLSGAASDQSASLEETSAAVEQLNSMVSRNSESAKQSSLAVKKGVQSVSTAQKVVEKMNSSMAEINSANIEVIQKTEESNTKIQEIVSIINEINSKTKVIHEIVFQTKLLSFNASVEAARAGENGKGFAVVAEEVGNLAQMSGNAAKEITTLLEGSVGKVESIISSSKASIEKIVKETSVKVASGSAIAQECGLVLNEISQIMSSVEKMADSIASASVEQSSGLNQISQAVFQLNETTQINAATSEESASTSKELSNQSVRMNRVVDSLAEIVLGRPLSENAESFDDSFLDEEPKAA